MSKGFVPAGLNSHETLGNRIKCFDDKYTYGRRDSMGNREAFKKLKDDLNLSILLITHDLGMVKHMADHVAVMTQGKIVESGQTSEVLDNPQHQYTKELMEALCC